MRVLEGQSPGYYIFPNAAAFAAEDLDPEEVADALKVMYDSGLLEREEFTITDDDGETITVPGGYRLKEA